MTHASLFSGIGGFDLAAEWMGWDNRFHCEINPFCQRILKHYWPNAKTYTDIKQTDITIWRNRIDILTGGFPCQPYSAAGKRLGKEDERHLWPEMLRAIREIKPRYIFGENVGGLLTWNDGLVFEEVCTDLENEGYEVQAFIIPACAKDAPHRRDRVWIVAHASSKPIKSRIKQTRRISIEKWAKIRSKFKPISEVWTSTNTNVQRCQGWTVLRRTQEIRPPRVEFVERFVCRKWQNFPTQSPVCKRNDGFPNGLVDITFSKWRSDSLKALGNAIVPQVVYEIFKAIENI